MTSADCPRPTSCPVPSPPPTTPGTLTTLARDTPFYRGWDVAYGYGAFNPRGNSRFAPLDAPAGPVPTIYGARDETVTLLESVFHEVTGPGGVIYEARLRYQALAHAQTRDDLSLLDLRTPALTALGMTRDQLITSSPAHYPCTREWSAWAWTTHPDAAGIIWNSRLAEVHAPALAGVAPAPASGRDEVFMLFGDRVDSSPKAFPLYGPGFRSLSDGPGRVLIDTIAEVLDATVLP